MNTNGAEETISSFYGLAVKKCTVHYRQFLSKLLKVAASQN